MELLNKRALITGGTAGIGAEAARLFVREGGSFTRTWAAEFGPRGVRVNSVAPGPTRTIGVLAEWGESIEDLAKSLPLGRTARPEEIAEVILFLASPRSSYVPGTTLAADGGATAI